MKSSLALILDFMVFVGNLLKNSVQVRKGLLSGSVIFKFPGQFYIN